MQFIINMPTVGIRKLFLIVNWLKALQLMQKRHVPSFFFTNMIGDEKAPVLCRINPAVSIS